MDIRFSVPEGNLYHIEPVNEVKKEKSIMKKMDNKGFSLVELIVVIAIMAVLIGVMAPTLLGNIEKSKLSKDKSSTDTLYSAWNNTVGDPEYNGEVSTGGTFTYNITSGTLDVDTPSTASITLSTAFKAQLEEYAGTGTIKYSSKYYKSGGSITVKVATSGKVSIEADSSDDKGDFKINE